MKNFSVLVLAICIILAILTKPSAAQDLPVVIFDTDFALPAMPVGDGSGTPVCIDNTSGLLVAGCLLAGPGDITGVTAGNGLSGGGASGTVILSHADTSSQGSVNNAGGNVIQDITLDTYGHVASLGSANLDDRYYTEAEADSNFVNTSGDSMTGALSVAANNANSVLSVMQNGTGHGIQGETVATGNSIAGVHGIAGLAGTTIAGKAGVVGESNTGKGVIGISQSGYGLFGWSTSSWAIRGEGQYGGIYGLAWAAGSDAIRGNNTATSGSSWGVVGTSVSPDGRGVAGFNSAATGNAEGVYGYTSSSSGRGVSGYSASTSGTNYGVYGQNNATSGGAGVYGDSPYVGVWGNADRYGVYGRANNSSSSYGVYGSVATGGYAGYFNGNVHVAGTLSKSSGSFKIDHPLDPENKYLYHSFVESPDMMNVYNGNVILDESGAAWVEMPDYFEALNQDFRYQLTAIGGPGPNLYIAERMDNNRFQIAGGSPGLEVSWQVTGIRHDAYAEAHRIVVEEEKPADERGTLLHPEAWGRDRSEGLDYQRELELIGPERQPLNRSSESGLKSANDAMPSLSGSG